MEEENMFIDNRKVKDNHQAGIERVKQREKGKMKECSGKMGKNIPSESNFKRSGSSLTPRKA